MRRRKRVDKNILPLLLVAFILSLDFADAIKGKWKPGNENERKFPIDRTLQNDRRISTEKTTQNARKIQNVGKMQYVRRFPNDRALQNQRRFPNDQTLRNLRGFPTDRSLQNVRGFPMDRTMQNVGGLPNDRTLQNFRRFPIDRTLQTARRFPIDRTLQTVRGFPKDRTLQNVRGFPNDKSLQNVREFVIDRTLPNYRRISTLKTIQNPRRIQIDEKMQSDRRVSVDRKFPNDRIMKYNERLQSYRINVTDGIMQNDKRINVNRLLEHNRRSQNELKKKIDSLMQNENIQIYEKVQDGKSILEARRIQNYIQSQKYLNEQNRRILDAHNEKVINSRRMQNDKRTWAATPHPIQRRQEKSPAAEHPSQEFNSTEFSHKITIKSEDEKSGGWSDFWKSLVLIMEEIRGLTPPGGNLLTIRACYSIATTYITANGDFKKYYMMRSFYENNIQFEVGYLVAEIVSKYQKMLELFHMTTDYYYNHQSKTQAHSIYVFYLYTNVLEMGTVIAHLCNMLTELEDKYRFIPVRPSGFSDYHLIKVMDDKDKVNMATQLLAYERKMAKLRKEKLRERKKMRDKSLHIGMVITTPSRRPKYRSWPLIYGWSIEGPW